MIVNLRSRLETLEFHMEDLYELLGETRQNHHQKLRRAERKRIHETALVKTVNAYRLDHPRMGSRPLYHLMVSRGEQIQMGLSQFEKFMSLSGLIVPSLKTKKPKTSDGKGKESYENLTNGLVLNGPNQLIVADITYYDIPECRSYLFALKDVYSQKILGLIPSKNMNSENAEQCLIQMSTQRGAEIFPGCIHHSDNGSQYNAKTYKEILSEMEIRISRAENCVQNGSIEQMNHIVKNMYLEPWCIQTFKQLKKACQRFVKLNNEQRVIKQLGNSCPDDFEKMILKLPEEQRPEKKLYDFNNWT